MLDVSVGCTNDNTYGVSCVFCGECGRKWTSRGVDDSEVVSKKVKQYKNKGGLIFYEEKNCVCFLSVEI